MRVIEIAYNIAVPASKLEIFKYIITAGRRGKLFVGSRVKAKAYQADQDIRTSVFNCRCSYAPIKKYSALKSDVKSSTSSDYKESQVNLYKKVKYKKHQNEWAKK